MKSQDSAGRRWLVGMVGVASSFMLASACGVDEEQQASSGALTQQQEEAIKVAGHAPVLPRTAHFGGRTYEAWMDLYMRWYYLDLWGFPPDDVVDRVQFVGGPQGAPTGEAGVFAGHRDVTVMNGHALALTCVFWGGERYTVESGLPDDPPQALECRRVTIDGRAIDPAGYSVHRPYEPIIEYPGVTPWNSVAAVYYQAVAFLVPPLSVGEHQVEIEAALPGLGVTRADLTMTITVVNK